MIDPDTLAAYVEKMRDLGVSSLKTSDLEIVLSPHTAAPPLPPPEKREGGPKPPSAYEQMLFACTEGLPDEDG